MTSAPVHITGPAEDTRRAHGATLNPLRDTIGKTAELLRRVDNTDRTGARTDVDRRGDGDAPGWRPG